MLRNRGFIFLIAITMLAVACKDRKHIGEKQVVKKPAQINKSATEIIQGTLTTMLNGDSIKGIATITNVGLLKEIYQQEHYLPLWTSDGKWTPHGDSLYALIRKSYYYGLFPSDYYEAQLSKLRSKLIADTAANENKLDAALWAETDLYLSAGFVQIIKDLKNGRIQFDKAALKKDSALTASYFINQFAAFKGFNVDSFATTLEPSHKGYKEIKEGMRDFVTTADLRPYTYINPNDSLNLSSNIVRRLNEEDSIDITSNDSLGIATAIKKYQKLHRLKRDGKINSSLVSRLNQTDLARFISIAINLDRYKQLPASMPDQYVWVNIPGYYLHVKENDTIRLISKVVVGKPETKTPIISSVITDMITYPQWTIPASIIKKDILPGLKKDPSYTLKKGFSLIDKEGNVVDPYLVDWTKYEMEIPYKVVQGSGDDNALGVLKFNFNNEHSVYLHDTNQRYLFSNKKRALSHGCVRVQNWDSLAYYILRNDSINSERAIPIDSMNAWLVRKEKHVVPVRKRVPLFIRYFTCEGKEDGLVFYEDVYGEDQRLRDKYFKTKNSNL